MYSAIQIVSYYPFSRATGAGSASFIIKDSSRKSYSLHTKTKTKNSSFKSSCLISRTKQANDSNFVASYLIETYGLSPKTAVSVSKKLNFEDTSKPDANLKFFQEYGFDKSQISKIISKCPNLLVANTKNVLQPKLEFLKQVGLSVPEIIKYIPTDPSFLCRSLENRIIPSFNYLKTLLLTNENVAVVMLNCSWIRVDLHTVMTPKIVVLRELGVPETNIRKFIMRYPRAFICTETSRFNKAVKEVGELEFKPSNMLFVDAIYVALVHTKATLEPKMEIFRSYGFTENEISWMFKRFPRCMGLSEKKLSKGLHFFINVMGLEPSYLTTYATLIGMSLERRVIPRWKVVQHLQSKGLIDNKVNVGTLFTVSNAQFFDSYVAEYEKDAPEILSLYEGNLY